MRWQGPHAVGRRSCVMPRRRKPVSESPIIGIGLDPEADATARAEADSPEGEALFQEIKRMEALAGAGDPAALDPAPTPDEALELAVTGPVAPNGDVPVVPVAIA